MYYIRNYIELFPLPLVESSLPHPLLTVERAFASSPVGRACLRILGEGLTVPALYFFPA
uniref:Uncharacterized protein n=1 Tax=Picea glauca TaxID=3330 RepID=A0A101M049_PICGL|nr:hypothetical protein ABT39_MTgene4596 [Picea glauca]